MFPHFSILTLVSLLSASLAVAADPVLKGDPVLIRENKIDAAPSLTTVMSFAGATFEAGTEGLSERAANFFVASSGAHSFNDTFALRGLTNTPIFGDPAVTFYLDDIPIGGGFTTPDIFSGVAKAELNRGPGQNTVFGQAGSAGVVRLTTPELGQKTTGQINLSAGNFSSRNAAVTVGSASGGPVEAYVSAQYGARNGYIFNDRLGHAVDHRESSSGLARLSFSASPLLKLSVIAQAVHAHDGEQPMVPLGGPMFVIERKNSGETNLDTFNAGLTAAVSMPWGHLSATTSINDWRLGPYRSVLSFGPAELINDVHLSRRNYNQELKLASNNTGSFHWHSGVFFSNGVTKGAFTRAFGPFVIEDSSYDIDAHTLAAYGETSWDVQPNITLTTGLRLENAKKTIDRTEKVPLPQIYNITHESSALLPKIELNYSVAPNIRLFGSIGAGFKPGGFSGFTGNRSLSAFGPERTIAWETGISQTALKGVLSSTVRAFLYDIRGYQIERSFATSSVADDYLVVNAPKARSVGAEWEFAWRPIPSLSLSSNFGFTQVTLREFKDPYTGQSFNGKQAPFVPRYDYALSVEYRNPSGWFGLVKWSENGRTYYTESENITFAQQSYGLFGGRLGCTVGQWSLAMYAENIFNQHYYSSMSAGTMHGTPGAPRTQGVEAQFAF